MKTLFFQGNLFRSISLLLQTYHFETGREGESTDGHEEIR